MARRKHGTPAIVAPAKRAGVEMGPHLPEKALDNLAICEMLGISKTTLKRWREELDFPSPDFVVGLREFTWHSRILDWTKARGTAHPQAGKRFAPTPEVAA